MLTLFSNNNQSDAKSIVKQQLKDAILASDFPKVAKLAPGVDINTYDPNFEF